jgi:hypothetical protein
MSLFLLSPFCCGGLFRYKKGSWEAVQEMLEQIVHILYYFFNSLFPDIELYETEQKFNFLKLLGN